jgi:ribosome-binding protein aMBF1 (putative translation factor)
MNCSLCGKTIPEEKYFSRKSVCVSCGGDLHVCLNCKFFSESSHNKCLEPKAEFQRRRDKANFCDFFAFRPDSVKNSGENEKEEARKKLDDLFRKN